MNIHEYQAKKLLKHAGVAVPDFDVVATADGAARAYDHLGGGLVVVKAQIHAGGRGKGVVVGPRADLQRPYGVACGRAPAAETRMRGVVLVRSKDEARQAAERMLCKKLITYQTGPAGQMIGKVLVTAGHDIDRELYLGITV